jgi:multidrug resistance efflux pump
LKNIIPIFSLIVSVSFADTYYAKIEPYHTYQIKAAVSGKVEYADIDREGLVGTDKAVVQLDDHLDKVDLETSQVTLKNLQESHASARTTERIKHDIYQKVKKLTTKSKFQKDAELINYLSAKDAVINLDTKINDMRYKIESLKDKIQKKSIILQGLYIYDIQVDKGDYVNPGQPLVEAYDLTRGRITLYLSKEDAKNVDNRVIYIDEEASSLKFQKVWKVADSTNISSYRAEIVVDKPKEFSKLVKIELR